MIWIDVQKSLPFYNEICIVWGTWLEFSYEDAPPYQFFIATLDPQHVWTDIPSMETLRVQHWLRVLSPDGSPVSLFLDEDEFG